jgi:hypothetical protein
MEKKKLVKRKKQAEKQERSKYVEQDPFAYILSDVKETVVTENYYQPIPASILKYSMPKGNDKVMNYVV